jgi:hypothetical protein
MLFIRAACSLSTDAQGVSIELGERKGVKWVGVRTFGPHELRLCLLNSESQKARRSQCCAACDRRQTPHKLDRRIASTGSPQSWVQSPDSKQEEGLIFPPTHLGEWLTDVDNSQRQRQRPRACAQASGLKARSPAELSHGSLLQVQSPASSRPKGAGIVGSRVHGRRYYQYGVRSRPTRDLASMCSAPPVREQTRLNLYIIPIPVRRVDWSIFFRYP